MRVTVRAMARLVCWMICTADWNAVGARDDADGSCEMLRVTDKTWLMFAMLRAAICEAQ